MTFRPEHYELASYVLNIRRRLIPLLNQHFTEVELGALRITVTSAEELKTEWALGGEDMFVLVPTSRQELFSAQNGHGTFDTIYERVALAMRKRLGLDDEEDEED